MQSETRERAWQYGAQMFGQVVLPAVEQVLEEQPGLGFPFDGKATLEEQCVGVFAAACECDKIVQRPANRHVRRAARAPQSAALDLEAQRERNVLDAQAEALACKFVEPLRQKLATQQLIDRERKPLRLQGCRRASQKMPDYGDRIGRHVELAQEPDRYSCHERQRRGLIPVNVPCGGWTPR